MRIFIGFVGIPLGFAIVFYRERIKSFTGSMDFAEKWFGAGGTYTFIMIFGLALTIGSLMYMLGTLQTIFWSIFGKLFSPSE